MFSPSFPCTLDGLRSAARLRYTLTGAPDPEQAAARYMRGYGVQTATWAEVETIRARIEVIIADIEHLTSCAEPETCREMVHAACLPPVEVGRRKIPLRVGRERLRLAE